MTVPQTEPKRILLIGKISHENFGDLLMGVYYAKWVAELGAVPVFYRADPRVKLRLEDEVACEFVDDPACASIAGAIYFGGGYFGHSATNFHSWPRQWLVDGYFITIHRWLERHDVSYIVSSVEIGPLCGGKIRVAVARILEGADFVAPRNRASLRFARAIAPGSTLEDGRDVVFEEERVPGHGDRSLPITLGIHAGEKLAYGSALRRRYIRGLMAAIERNASKISRVVVFFDSASTRGSSESADRFANDVRSLGIEVVVSEYADLKATLAVLRGLTHFVTTKLHAGVVVKASGGRVLAINDQPKVRRFYRSIDSGDDVISFYLSSASRISRRVDRLFGSASVRVDSGGIGGRTHQDMTKTWLRRLLVSNA